MKTRSLFFPLMLIAALGAIGCATENKVLKAPRYSLSYPEFWKVQTVAKKDGEPTHLTIGKYSESVMTAGEGGGADSIYEASQAEVDVRIYAWPAPTESADPTQKVLPLLKDDPDLQLSKQAKLAADRDECGRDFKRKFTILKQERDTLDLASRPGHRLIIVAGESDGTLLSVVTRVPFEQDTGLYCHNLTNMRLQLQNVLDGLTLTPPGAAAPPADGKQAP